MWVADGADRDHARVTSCRMKSTSLFNSNYVLRRRGIFSRQVTGLGEPINDLVVEGGKDLYYTCVFCGPFLLDRSDTAVVSIKSRGGMGWVYLVSDLICYDTDLFRGAPHVIDILLGCC